MAAQTMASKNVTRNNALRRLAIVFGCIGLLCGGIAMFAPIDDVVLSRRSSQVPLGVILWGMFIGMTLLAALCSGSMDRE